MVLCAALKKQRGRLATLDGRFTPHFNLNVVVQFVRRVSVAVQADVTALHALGIGSKPGGG